MLLAVATIALTMQVVPDRDLSAPVNDLDIRLVESCLEEAKAPGKSVPECIGAVNTPCQTLPGGYSTYGMLACLTGETAVWDRLMDRWLQRASETLGETDWSKLQASQASWARSTERSLALYDERDGTIWPVVRESYRMDWTARRALWVRELTELN